jgi:hypothetical protein
MNLTYVPIALFVGAVSLSVCAGAIRAEEAAGYASGKMKICMSKEARPNVDFVFAAGTQFRGDDGVWIAPKEDVTLSAGRCKTVEGQVAPDFSKPSDRPSVGVAYQRDGAFGRNDIATATIVAPFR